MNQNHKSRPTNISSMLLNQSENDSLFQVIGRGCVTLATGVVQLYLAEPSDRSRWSKRCCGVACFVKDNPKRSYYIRVYDIKKGQMMWEQELYNQFRYKTPREYFHTFEAQSCVAGLNFASEDEAGKFQKAVEGKLQERQNRRREKKRQPSLLGQSEPPPLANRPPNQVPSQSTVMMQPPVTNLETSSKNGSTTALSKKDKKKDKSKKLTKADIGAPTEFRHVSHVGWDPTKGFDMNNLDPDMQTLFQSVGISATDELDKETVDFIYDFVEKHGGMDAVRQEIKRAPSSVPSSGTRPGPPPPQRAQIAPPPPSRGAVPPPPPPSRGPSNSRGGAPPPPPPNRGPARAPNAAPPPPPPSTPKSAPPPLPPTGRSVPPPPPPTAGAPPPPPPPPAAGPPPPPPPPPPPGPGMDMGGSSSGEGRGALLAAIQAGTKLKSVDASEPAVRSMDSRGQLLDAIRQGAKLRQVDEQEVRSSMEIPSDMQDGLVGALARALASRRPAVESDEDESSEDEEEEEDEDEWDD